MEAKELAAEYKQQAKIIQEKIDALAPLALIYKGTDLEVLKKKLKINVKNSPYLNKEMN